MLNRERVDEFYAGILGIGPSLWFNSIYGNLGIPPLVSWDASSLALPTGATFTRASTAYVQDNLGVLWLAPVDGPRFGGARITSNAGVLTYYGTDAGGIPIDPATIYLLDEPAGTNLCLQSEAAGTTWTQTNVTIANNSIAAPNGELAADTLTASASNATWTQSTTATSAQKTWSIWIKRKTGTGAISMSMDGGSTYTEKTITSDWVRYSITQTLANPAMMLKIATDGDAVYVWGSQLETGAVATSYIPTTTTSISRAADVLNFSGVTGYPPFSVTNRARYSNTPASGWGKNASPSGATFTNNALMAPPKTIGYGTMTAGLVTPEAALGAHIVWQTETSNASIQPSTTYCRSIYLNRNGSQCRWISLRIANAAFGGTISDCRFDLVTGEGAIVAGTYISNFGSEYVGEGWWRFWVVGTTDADGGTCVLGIVPVISLPNNQGFTGDGTGFGVYGGQFELGAGPPKQLAVTPSTVNATGSDNEIRIGYLDRANADVVDWDGVVNSSPDLYGKIRSVKVYNGDLS